MSRIPYAGTPVGYSGPLTPEIFEASAAESSAAWTVAAEEYAAGIAGFASGVGEAAVLGYGVYSAMAGSKRSRLSVTGRNTERTVSFPSTRCVQYDKRVGKKARPTLMKLYKQVQAASQHAIDRWQSINPQFYGVAPLTHYLGLTSMTTGAYAGQTLLPCYCFNLTALASNLHNRSGTIAQCVSAPFYRLAKHNTTGAYTWYAQQGSGNSTTGAGLSYFWSPEETNCTVAREIENYVIDWVNFRAAFKGATSYPSEIDVMRVKFSDQGAPNRTYAAAAAPATLYGEDVAATGDEANENTAFWDHYFASRTMHPLRSSYIRPGTISPLFRVLSKKTHRIGPITSAQEIDPVSSESVVGKYVCDNQFYRMNQRIVARSENPNVTNTARIIGDGVTTGTGPAFIDTVTTASRSMFQDRDKDVYVMISAKSHVHNTETVPGNQGMFYPTFDLCVRRKITWSQDTT